MELVRPIDVRGDSGIDIRSERVKLYVIEREKFDTELQRLGIQLPHIVDVITVGYLATAENNIYGGLVQCGVNNYTDFMGRVTPEV